MTPGLMFLLGSSILPVIVETTRTVVILVDKCLVDLYNLSGTTDFTLFTLFGLFILYRLHVSFTLSRDSNRRRRGVLDICRLGILKMK